MQPKSKPESVNELPVARFVYDANNLTVVFNASASSDPDGSIANYSWIFGDETGAFGEAVGHIYAMNGTYNVTLTVADNKGGKNSTSRDLAVSMKVTPVEASKPMALIEIQVNELTVSVSGAKSRAPEGGSIVIYSWAFGDGAAATGVNATHTYAANGSYMITLIVTDDKGATGNTSVIVDVKATPVEAPKPVALIEIQVNELTVSVSGAKSRAPAGGSIVSYSWTFGDEAAATGVNATHKYAANGSYMITLTVTDDKGTTGNTSVIIDVKTNPTPSPPPHHPPCQKKPPGERHAIENHNEKAHRNWCHQDSRGHNERNHENWSHKHSCSP